MNRRQAIQAIGGGTLAVAMAGKIDAKTVGSGDVVLITTREGSTCSIEDIRDDIIKALPQLAGRVVILDGFDVTVVSAK